MLLAQKSLMDVVRGKQESTEPKRTAGYRMSAAGRHGTVSGPTPASGRAEFPVELGDAMCRDHRPAGRGTNRAQPPIHARTRLLAACSPGFGNGSGALTQSGNPVCDCQRRPLTRGRAFRDPCANFDEQEMHRKVASSRANGGIGERRCGISSRLQTQLLITSQRLFCFD